MNPRALTALILGVVLALGFLALLFLHTAPQEVESERLYRQTLHGVRGALGASHYLTLKTTYGLAKTLEGRDETEESVNLYRRAAKEGHQESLDALNRLGLPVTP